jgi:hypothetical protein
MIGVGQRKQEPSDEEAAKTTALWGPNPVHPSSAAYRTMADSIMDDINNPEARYTNPAKHDHNAKRPRHDPSQDRASWVSGCSAALARRDSGTQKSSRGQAAMGRTDNIRGLPARGNLRGQRCSTAAAATTAPCAKASAAATSRLGLGEVTASE